MADGLSVNIVTDGTLRELAAIRAEVDKVTRTILRDTAKQVAAQAKVGARSYAGPRRDVPKGRLRRSVKAGRVVREPGGGFSVKVKPTGWPAVGYAGKIEALQPFMAPAHATAEASMRVAADVAWGKATKR